MVPAPFHSLVGTQSLNKQANKYHQVMINALQERKQGKGLKGGGGCFGWVSGMPSAEASRG